MRYKAISLAIAILLIATPGYAQEVSSIVVETPKTANPTTVITGQLLTQTFVVRFIDLTDEGEEIIVQEDGLNPGMLGNFEVLRLDPVKLTPPPKQFREHWWYLTYTLRIVNAKKGPYIIPPLTVPWVKKRVGQNISDPSLKVNTDFKTNEVHINYVTIIPEKETNLDVRDEMNFGSFSSKAVELRVYSWLLGTVPLLIFVTLLVRNRRSVRRTKESDSQISPEAEDTSLSVLKVVSKKKALRNLRRRVPPDDFYKLIGVATNEDLFRVEVRLSEPLNDFLRAELSLNVGATPLEMAAHVEQKLKDGRRKKLLLRLTETAVLYYQDVERGKCLSSADFSVRTTDLRQALKDMRWYSRLFAFARRK